jgi:hypothetical protein
MIHHDFPSVCALLAAVQPFHKRIMKHLPMRRKIGLAWRIT